MDAAYFSRRSTNFLTAVLIRAASNSFGIQESFCQLLPDLSSTLSCPVSCIHEWRISLRSLHCKMSVKRGLTCVITSNKRGDSSVTFKRTSSSLLKMKTELQDCISIANLGTQWMAFLWQEISTQLYWKGQIYWALGPCMHGYHWPTMIVWWRKFLYLMQIDSQ